MMDLTSDLPRILVGERPELRNPRMKNAKYFDLITARRSEYSDEVEKANKKQNLLLTSQLKILDRQERVAQNTLKKTIVEAERLKQDVLDRRNRSLDLRTYDKKRAHARFESNTSANDPFDIRKNVTRASAFTVGSGPQFLPPIHRITGSAQSTPRKRKSHDVGLYVRTQPKMLSMRALRDTTSPVVVTAPEGKTEKVEAVTTSNKVDNVMYNQTHCSEAATSERKE